MVRRPETILHLISWFLRRDRWSFLLTHRDATKIMGDRQKSEMDLWNTFFKSYKWVEVLKSHGIQPMLFVHDKSYVTLALPKWTTPQPQGGFLSDYKVSIPGFGNEFRTSLQPYGKGANDYEIKFGDIVLNISHVIHPGFITIGDRVRDGRVRILPYDERSYDRKLEILIKGFNPVPMEVKKHKWVAFDCGKIWEDRKSAERLVKMLGLVQQSPVPPPARSNL